MKWKCHYSHPLGFTFEIERQDLYNRHQETVGEAFYLYVYDEKGNNTHDFMQDTLHWAQHNAFENFGVPMDSWNKTDEPLKFER